MKAKTGEEEALAGPPTVRAVAFFVDVGAMAVVVELMFAGRLLAIVVLVKEFDPLVLVTAAVIVGIGKTLPWSSG